MSEAQLGILTVTPIIIAFAGVIRATGVLSTAGAASAILFSGAIAVLLLTTQ